MGKKLVTRRPVQVGSPKGATSKPAAIPVKPPQPSRPGNGLSGAGDVIPKTPGPNKSVTPKKNRPGAA